MILQHGYQNNETMLQALQLIEDEGYRPEPQKTFQPAPSPGEGMVHIPGGPFVMGTDDRSWALDNERGAHEVGGSAFELGKTPATYSACLEFVEDGGYEKEL
jgi:gamma-glutamyl hercynylcysteine S-oxide synthase